MFLKNRSRRLVHLAEEERRAARRRFAPKKRYRSPDYGFLLEPYESTHRNLTLGEFARTRLTSEGPVLLLRHDIDHDYETALEMAAWEHARGLRATYCVLHTAWYYGTYENGRQTRTDEVARLCRELHAMGHEINLHNNAVVLALQTGADPRQVLHDEVVFLRSLGVPVTGSATHGDALCRKMNFGNFEIFREAVKDDRGGPRTVSSEHAAVRLGSLCYADVDLVYEGYDFLRDIYISDSGGRLRSHRNAAGRPALDRPPGRGEVVGVLTHPVWWDFGS
jgi:hypothetical protein